MIDTKIACQCGNRFKFGMDLVNGRAPDGLVCPTCGAPATPPCNAFVDFLSGKEPPSIGTGSRPLKEIRVVCACGARYKFDLELAEKEMPGAVTCPGCQADLTPLANEEIRTYITKHAADLAAPASAPTPAPAPPVTAAAPAVEPAPASPATPTQSAAPVPAPAPALAEAPAAATPASVSSPATPAPVTPTPPAAPVPSVTPVSDPFGPAPTGKSSGPNLKPLEVPKPNRPPPGSRPATPPAKPAGAPTAAATAAKSAKPDAGKPAKPAARPAATSGEPSLGKGIAGAVTGALIGAIVWFVILKATPMTAAWMATVTGGLAGLGARLLGRGASPELGRASCIAATLVICLMVWVTMGRHIDRQMAPQLASQFKATLDRAQAAVNAKTDAELRPFVAQTVQVADMETARVSDEAIRAFKATELPKMKEFLADRDNFAKFEARQRALYRDMYPFEDVWQETFGIFGLLFLLGGIIAAAKLAMK
jgi:hypothetical protein